MTGCENKKPEPPPAQLVDAPTMKSVSADGLSELLTSLRKPAPKRYLAVTKEESAEYRAWLAHLVDSAVSGILPSKEAPSGFVGRFAAAGTVWVFAEDPKQRRGAGVVLLRADAKNELIVECPHSFFDEGTLPVALSVFNTLGARALLVNTMHRGGTGPRDKRLKRAQTGEGDTDLAHNEDTFFHSAHVELGEHFIDATFLQLHGYRDEQVPTAKFVVSAAGSRAKPEPISRALNAAFGVGSARTYPVEVKRLGGTTNVQARASKVSGHRFIHLEIASSLRHQLKSQESLRVLFAQAVAQGLEPSGL